MNENITEEEFMNEEVEDTEMEVKDSKIKTVIKKYGKKIAIGAGVVAVGFVSYKLGKKCGLKVEDLPVNDIIQFDEVSDVVENATDIIE